MFFHDGPLVGSTRKIRSSGLVLFFLLILLLLWPSLAPAQQQVVQGVIIHGNRRVPTETIRARIFTKPGDIYDPAALERDYMSLWNSGFFEDIRMEREDTPKGPTIHVYVKEKPTIREITYLGLSSVSQSDVLDRFKERKVGLTVENQYDPTKVKKAEVTIKELLAEHGRQFATIRTEVRPIPPAAVAVSFVVKEGPKVKVGRIKFEGNKNLNARYLRHSMKNLRPIGIPHSIFLEDLMSKTYDASKLSEDTERVRDAYQQKGYFKALVQDPKTHIRDTGGGFHVPLIQKGGGKAVDITMPVEEGAKYRLAGITFKNNKAIRNNEALRKLFPIKDGDTFNTALIRKGLDELRKAYGAVGYINFTAVPDTKIDDDKRLISLDIDVDEGKQFFVRRIEFQGNTTTRDKVIRRELALEEGQVYNSKAWEFSMLRLNQLGYFEQLKPEQDSEIKQNAQEGTVDITLKVKEKGKNSIGLTGGVSGLAGSFIGLNYQTNNFLGLGETLSVSFNIGSLERNIMFGFTEPYTFDRPLQLGFTVFNSRYNFDQARYASILSGQPLNLPTAYLNTLQNFTQNTTGFTTSASYPLHRSLKRVSLTYSFDNSSVTVFSQASQLYFESLAFSGLSGPNALQGVITSKVIPALTWSTLDSATQPTRGHSYYFAGEIAGLGGTVKSLRPIVEYKRFTPMKGIMPTKDVEHRTGSLGFRVQGSFLTGYGGLVAPPFARFYMGGDNDLRGFDIRAVSPVAFITQEIAVPLQNPDGSFVPKNPLNPRAGNITIPVPINQLVFPGGDTSLVSNLEYRIPIVGPVVLAPFVDFGMDFVARNSQLRLSEQAIAGFQNVGFGCASLDLSFNCVPSVPAGGLKIPGTLQMVPGSNYTPRLSSGLELQVLMPIINAPFRVYWAYNALRMDTFADTPVLIRRDMFPPGGAGDFTFQQVLRNYAPAYRLREPRKTFRFTVSTTF